ncbi:hypothetical protein E0485_03745 [Paenibacillus albiflavus]|uniref:Uncharacterized protein n=1 Tax=Paenibacillus albiflavus TaxID=2545760 RepID=A0A4R4EIK2_9BACL|nr:hypothetical protein [Paenibacillus albiflavus]TCZ79984.1 hypothetical protein E0485_03745 [Paenibacillus albiflavus]
MMIGTLLWNIIGGGIAFVGTFLLSIQSNLLTTSLLRGLYSFIIMFVLIFVARWVIAILLLPSPASKVQSAEGASQEEEQSHVGQRFDMVTPEDEPASSGGSEGGFTPLSPPKLETKPDPTPESVVQAIRHLSEE